MGEKIVEGLTRYWKTITILAAIVGGLLAYNGLPARVRALEANDKTQDSRLDKVETRIDVQFDNISKALERIEKKVDRR